MSIFPNELPLAAYFPAHVVAWLESKDSAHPRINVVHTELQKLMRLSAPAAINAVEMSTHYEIISWAPSPNGGKDILFLDDKQQAQLRQVERQLAALQKQFADLTHVSGMNCHPSGRALMINQQLGVILVSFCRPTVLRGAASQ